MNYRDRLAEKIFLLDYSRILSALDRSIVGPVGGSVYMNPEDIAHTIGQMARISYVMADVFLAERVKQPQTTELMKTSCL